MLGGLGGEATGKLDEREREAEKQRIRLVYYMPKKWQVYSSLGLFGLWMVENVS